MKNTIAIQISSREDSELLKDKQALDVLGIVPIWYGLIPFSDEVINADQFEHYDSIITLGSVKLVKLFLQDKLPKNAKVFYEEPKFDQRYYGRPLDTHLLNHMEFVWKFGEIKDIKYNHRKFMKPVNDLKAFPGVIVDPNKSLSETLENFIIDSSLSDEEPVIIADYREIDIEYRIFVVDNNFIDCSIYKECGIIKHKRPNEYQVEYLKQFHEKISKLYAPHKHYVMDVAELPSGDFKVIEYNCINCSGMYTVDRKLVYNALLNSLWHETSCR